MTARAGWWQRPRERRRSAVLAGLANHVVGGVHPLAMTLRRGSATVHGRVAPDRRRLRGHGGDADVLRAETPGDRLGGALRLPADVRAGVPRLFATAVTQRS